MKKNRISLRASRRSPGRGSSIFASFLQRCLHFTRRRLGFVSVLCVPRGFKSLTSTNGAVLVFHIHFRYSGTGTHRVHSWIFLKPCCELRRPGLPWLGRVLVAGLRWWSHIWQARQGGGSCHVSALRPRLRIRQVMGAGTTSFRARFWGSENRFGARPP